MVQWHVHSCIPPSLLSPLSLSYPYPVSPHIPQPKSGGFKFTAVESKGFISNDMCFVSTKCKVFGMCVYGVWVQWLNASTWRSDIWAGLICVPIHACAALLVFPNRYTSLGILQVLICLFHQVWNCLLVYVIHYRLHFFDGSQVILGRGPMLIQPNHLSGCALLFFLHLKHSGRWIASGIIVIIL